MGLCSVGHPWLRFSSILGEARCVGYPALIHKLAYRRANHETMHVRGYKEKGSINTPLGLTILNQVDRFSLAIDVIDMRAPRDLRAR